jgi:hypothetical protein
MMSQVKRVSTGTAFGCLNHHNLRLPNPSRFSKSGPLRTQTSGSVVTAPNPRP